MEWGVFFFFLFGDGWLVGWFIGWFIGWLVGWFVVCAPCSSEWRMWAFTREHARVFEGGGAGVYCMKMAL